MPVVVSTGRPPFLLAGLHGKSTSAKSAVISKFSLLPVVVPTGRPPFLLAGLHGKSTSAKSAVITKFSLLPVVVRVGRPPFPIAGLPGKSTSAKSAVITKFPYCRSSFQKDVRLSYLPVFPRIRRPPNQQLYQNPPYSQL
ncbi:hypothetical protein [Fundicoccus culcitae]|uniref:Uncharacterized protein n=1 Tax=Fundicoccus culcitae TaxID=2969821 RepID=A0ABY5P8C8_9LACT|nr:hypothetical protein [Fundicoccus culcitae]UUX35004.1 hypothetical protein NRE15_04995 [Fundicoccus culcitae]